MSIPEYIYTVLLKPPFLRSAANFFLTSILPSTLKVKGATIHLNPSDPVVSGALTLRSYEREEIAFFVRWFEQGMTFVDVGANVGLYTGLALHRSPRSRVLCVEPDKISANYLKRTIESNTPPGEHSTVSLIQAAASDSKGKLTLYKNSQNKGDNRIYRDPLCDESESIESDTLDHLCEEANIRAIHFLKVDVQGAEFRVFSGARGILAQSTDCIVMTEFWPYGLRQCGGEPERYLALLRELGFVLFELAGEELLEVGAFENLIARAPGRVYRNLIGLKGKFVEKQKAKA